MEKVSFDRDSFRTTFRGGAWTMTALLSMPNTGGIAPAGAGE